MMKLQIKSLACFMSIIACCAILTNCSRPLDEWELYKKTHGKHYASVREDRIRFLNYQRAKIRIEEHNAKANASYKMQLNHMSDWHRTDFEHLNGLDFSVENKGIFSLNKQDEQISESDVNSPNKLREYLSNLLELNSEEELLEVVPAEVDWRKIANRVTAVKDQLQCSSCWAFSVTGLLEGQQVKRNFTKQLISLSEQELIDCSHSDYGCRGGLPTNALHDIHSIGGIEDESDYPYEARDEKCKFNRKQSIMNVKGYKVVAPNEQIMKHVVANYGPISVGFDANDNLRHYESGVFSDETCTDQLNHGVLIVGYGTDKATGKDYWLVKNSWSADWGDKGYFKIERNSNMCGIKNLVSIAMF